MIIIPEINRVLFLIVAIISKMLGHNALSVQAKKNRIYRLLGVRQLDLSTSNNIGVYAVQRNCHLLSERIVERLFTKQVINTFSKEYNTVPSAQRKLRTCLYYQIKGAIRGAGELLAICQVFEAQGVFVRAFFCGDPSTVKAWKTVSNVPIFNFTMGWYFSQILRISRRIVKKLFQVRSDEKSNTAKSDYSSTNPTETVINDYQVVYFPHKGIKYGDLFTKDQYYIKDETSPFHPSRILHLELAGMLSAEEKSSIVEDYQKQGLPFHILENRPYGFKEMKRFFQFCWSRKKKKGDLPNEIIGFISLFSIWLQFASWRQVFKRLSSARVALLGYDYLFPPVLAMALQSRGIRVFASQERFIQTFYHDIALILDCYCVCGPKVKEKLRSNSNCIIDQIVITGNVRNDVLYQHTSKTRKTAQNSNYILVFDFHSDPDESTRVGYPVANNWASNLSFYRDIIRLARHFSNARFVIRGKDIEWMCIPYFCEVLQAIESLENVDVDTDYATINRSYELAAKATCAVARHTSIGDEMLAAGIPVIFHDYSPNFKTMASSLFDYEGLPLFVYDYQSLENRVREILDGKFLDEGQFEYIRRHFYGDSFDGKVRSRLHREMTRMLDYKNK